MSIVELLGIFSYRKFFLGQLLSFFVSIRLSMFRKLQSEDVSVSYFIDSTTGPLCVVILTAIYMKYNEVPFKLNRNLSPQFIIAVSSNLCLLVLARLINDNSMLLIAIIMQLIYPCSLVTLFLLDGLAYKHHQKFMLYLFLLAACLFAFLLKYDNIYEMTKNLAIDDLISKSYLFIISVIIRDVTQDIYLSISNVYNYVLVQASFQSLLGVLVIVSFGKYDFYRFLIFFKDNVLLSLGYSLLSVSIFFGIIYFIKEYDLLSLQLSLVTVFYYLYIFKHYMTLTMAPTCFWVFIVIFTVGYVALSLIPGSLITVDPMDITAQ